MKATIFKIFTILLLIEAFILFNSFDTLKITEPILVLHDNTYIFPIIDNFDIPSKTFIRTLKVKYIDRNKRVQMNDSTYYRCAYETKMTFYSAFDSLELNSLSRKSCEITAFFNLQSKDIKWMIDNHVYFIKIKNMNTKYELLLENTEPRFFTNTLLRYNKIKD
jgi:hypothetical protein